MSIVAAPLTAPPTAEAIARANRSQAAWIESAPCRPLLADLVAHLEQTPPATEEGKLLLQEAQATLDRNLRSVEADEKACLQVLRSIYAFIIARQGRTYVPPWEPVPSLEFKRPVDQAMFARLDALIRQIDRAAMQAEERRKQQQRGRRPGPRNAAP